jgi:hypothetical protein
VTVGKLAQAHDVLNSPQGSEPLQEDNQVGAQIAERGMKKKKMSMCMVFMRGCRCSLSMLNNIGTVNETAEPKRKLAGFTLAQETFEKEW